MSLTKEELQAGLEGLKTAMNEALNEKLKAVAEKSEAAVEAANKRIEEIEREKGDLQAQVSRMEVNMKDAGGNGNQNPFTFSEVMAKSIKDNIEKIQNYKSGDKVLLKAAGDMSFTNFVGDSYRMLTTDVQRSPLPLLTEQIWIADLLPKGTTKAGSIWYPRHTGGEGGADVWKEGNGNKPIMDFDFDGTLDKVSWITGTVKVDRSMLDDIEWLTSFLQQNMWLRLKRKENYQILNGDGVGENLKGILPLATAYSGDRAVSIERIIDAAYSQIGTGLGQANIALLHRSDIVKLMLNKAAGSQEYDLPPGTVSVINGQLNIAGLNLIGTSEITAGSFLVGDTRASQFISRMEPELRMFDQNENDARTNKILFRLEERAALATYYPQWWVKGSLTV